MSFSQQTSSALVPDFITTYYQQKLSLFKSVTSEKDNVIFLGDSITEGGQWSELFNDLNILNRGISGDVTAGVLYRLEEVYKRKPKKIFLLIGVNDLARGVPTDLVIDNIQKIVQIIHEYSPNTKVFVQSILPVNNAFNKFNGHVNKNNEIVKVNTALLQSAYSFKFEFIDLYHQFVNNENKLDVSYTNDGLHLLAPAYLKWKQLIEAKLYDYPALIPYPLQVTWEKTVFSLKECNGIFIANNLSKEEATFLAKKLKNFGYTLPITNKKRPSGKYIQLLIDSSEKNNNESYTLEVNTKDVAIKSNGVKGLFYAIQTFIQLKTENGFQACSIKDAPAFSFRGYMIDVGRNYQSVKQIKEQIDQMSFYKLNVFHMHLTEDIAWRVNIKQFPSLTKSTNMLRHPGKFYTIDELKDLIAYCKQRQIQFIPEIDMPGHSGAFERALGFSMQSERGIEACKSILNELINQLNLDIIHIGGDEVKYIYKDFLFKITNFLKEKNIKVIAWDPGGNVPKGTILQMWNGDTKVKNAFPALDSRHLYLNHFDPLEGVNTVFNHKIDDVEIGDSLHLGGILCNWHDRNLNSEKDVITMNGVYPVMITFSERTWRGGGYFNYNADLGSQATEQFKSFVFFENRLLEHKYKYFQNESFPYNKQTNQIWNLHGPYYNQGSTTAVFPPEQYANFDSVHSETTNQYIGGTIVLRHFWSPMIAASLQQTTDSTTWYASSILWSEKEITEDFWIGFNNISRSTATDPNPMGEWDNKSSKLWVNGFLINPPEWKHANTLVNLETPLLDEGYEYRTPTKIHLKKGMNKILIKCPIASFKGKDWQNPVKWQFTFIPAH